MPEGQLPRESSSAEAAALRRAEGHSDEDVVHSAPNHVPEVGDVVPNHHSASAEAAALRWREGHDEEEA